MSKFVQVMQIPGGSKNIQVDDNSTVGDACRAAGFIPDGYNVTVSDNTSATLDSSVNSGSKIVLTRQVKGA